MKIQKLCVTTITANITYNSKTEKYYIYRYTKSYSFTQKREKTLRMQSLLLNLF